MKKLVFVFLILPIFILGIKFYSTKDRKPLIKIKKMIKITSPAFSHNNWIPKQFTCQGEDVNPPLKIENVPPKTKSLVLIVDDPDAPFGVWTHWLVWNIKPETKMINQNSHPPEAVIGKNSWGKNIYQGPCPPSGIHRYFFKIYALDTTLNISSTNSRKELEQSIIKHIINQGELIGKYGR